ncbi:TIGR03943 family protein [Thalassobacillus sp. C254]|uniref:TIGR03943 family putative permease subunit n=1 Tax=Thalassobacillus sp. C254 TaxID=1225341 RepID=UPI0022B7230E|nr:TIGR03943 family protein [Thalassobacillus sp. C254]
MFGFSLPDQVLDSSVAANRGIQYGSGIFTSPTANPERIVTEKSIGEVAETEQEGSDGDKYDEYYKDLAQAYSDIDRIIINEENFLEMLSVIDLYIDNFIGKEVEVTGFVYTEPEMKDNQLVVARFSMTCCIADATVYGILIESEEPVDVEEDTWVTVHGKINKGSYNGFVMPTVSTTNIEQVSEPDMPYVFPSFK